VNCGGGGWVEGGGDEGDGRGGQGGMGEMVIGREEGVDGERERAILG